MALGAGVGAELGVAADAHGPALAAHEPLPPEVFATVEAVRAVGHRCTEGGSHTYSEQGGGGEIETGADSIAAANSNIEDNKSTILWIT